MSQPNDRSTGWELRLLDAIATRTTSARAVKAARAVTMLGETPVVWAAVAGAAAVAGLRSGSLRVAVRPVLVLAVGAGTRRALAELIGRRRPPERLWRTHWTRPSFPSRHTTLATLGAGLVADALTTTNPARAVARDAAVAVAAGVGVSRLVLGVHWPTDVLAGWSCAAIVLTIARRYEPSRGME